MSQRLPGTSSHILRADEFGATHGQSCGGFWCNLSSTSIRAALVGPASLLAAAVRMWWCREVSQSTTSYPQFSAPSRLLSNRIICAKIASVSIPKTCLITKQLQAIIQAFVQALLICCAKLRQNLDRVEHLGCGDVAGPPYPAPHVSSRIGGNAGGHATPTSRCCFRGVIIISYVSEGTMQF